MSKHHNNYRNYNSYSSAKNPVEEAVKQNEVNDEELIVDENETGIEEEMTETVNSKELPEETKTNNVEPKPVTGVVSDCAKLRVRDAANTDSAVLCEIDAGTEVKIDESKSTTDFYKVCTAAGFEGFCMKRFITVQ